MWYLLFVVVRRLGYRLLAVVMGKLRKSQQPAAPSDRTSSYNRRLITSISLLLCVDATVYDMLDHIGAWIFKDNVFSFLLN